MGLEETASRVLAAQVAGAIALWTQLYTFEDGPPEAMAWAALFIFILSICFLGMFLRPRRLVRFWDKAIPDELFGAKAPVTFEQEGAAIEHISTMMRGHRDQLERGIRVSVPLGILALVLVAVGYAVEKAFYAP
jgi:hypothetical protein